MVVIGHGPAEVLGAELRFGRPHYRLRSRLFDGAFIFVAFEDENRELRAPIDAKQANDILRFVRESEPAIADDSARFQEWTARIRASGAFDIAGIYRDVRALPAASDGEKKILAHAEDWLSIEVADALSVSRDDAKQLLRAALA
jgi:RNA polymerase-interacting CarD/CdnL/TRCF family regulator